MSMSVTSSLKLKRLIIKLIFIVLTLVIAALFLLTFKIKDVQTDGNVYTPEEDIVSAAAINVGSHIYSIDKNAIAENVMRKNPYVISVSVRRTLPSTLRLIVTEDKPAFYSLVGDDFCVISPSLRVLEKHASSEQLSGRGLIPIVLPETKSAQPGTEIVFRDKKDGEVCRSLIEKFLSSDISEQISSIDLSERFDITLMYNKKYTVVFGDYSDIDKKLRLAVKTIRHVEETMPTVKGTVYASIEGEASFLVTGTVS